MLCFPEVFGQLMTGIVVNFVCSRQTAFGIRVLFSVFERWKLPPAKKKILLSLQLVYEKRKKNPDATRSVHTLQGVPKVRSSNFMYYNF